MKKGWYKKALNVILGDSQHPDAKIVSASEAPPSVTEKATMSTKTSCPYCDSTDFVKRGVRQKKHEAVQLYVCRAEGCGRTFTAERVKGKRFPLAVIIEGISYYNMGLSLEQTCDFLGKKFPDVAAPTLASWVEEYKNRRFGRLKEYLEHVSSETPHQYFADGERMSEIRTKFDKTDMIVKSKHNFANDLAEFVLRSVTENKDRHEALQRFMIANDSVTVATEVPVYIRKEDIEHMENVLKFKILGEGGLVFKGDKGTAERAAGAETTSARGRLLTGHIDFVQIRNGMVHILDYKPNASKEKPIEQLTWYALALSRLTGLRLFEFKCAWFDDKDFYEFYPLHIVKKLQPKKRARKVHYRDGTVATIPRSDELIIT